MSTMIATGFLCSTRWNNRRLQLVGLGLIGVGIGLYPNLAFADQTSTVDDNSKVDCLASQKDLTRVSLVGDEFASVSKMQPANPLDDFSVVNEPTRGDIYLSVPDGYRPKTLSFFGTTKKGFVYKFTCKIEAVEAQQIFLTNPLALVAEKEETEEAEADTPDNDELAVRLIQAMAAGQGAQGFRVRTPSLVPVKVGDLSVKLESEYSGLDLVGNVIRIENISTKAVSLNESIVAPSGAVAVSIRNRELLPKQITTAFVVVNRSK